MATIYKICPATLWREASAEGVFRGSPVDITDGFIHFSTAAQVAETALKHFSGQADLVLIAFDDADIGDVRYEPSRGGQLFPHLYAPLDPTHALWVRPIAMQADGTPVLPIVRDDL
jgi:uncharacterized protein (DUF952 family)